MTRVDRRFDNRPAPKEFLRTQADDDVSHRKLEPLKGERARVAEADEGPAAANELLEPLHVVGGELIRVFRTNLRPRTTAAAAPTGRAGDRNARIVRKNEH